MGRGRAKAKQTKVARQLKYSSGGTDLSRLAEELGASTAKPPSNGQQQQQHVEEESPDDDLYSRYAELYEDEDDEDGEDSAGSSEQRRGA
ncbi:DUF3073 domain-containing protein [Streptomyces sp. WMMC500]|uniref:DUF3073 domain-containing protein n=1 Tax=Streptomyces sp. WMMC500 TaxID=3015154 RepID=UPI00248C693C|nr:DUF3073 domain-containing protein [Streptomyces sp. WMMC500]WBB64157.1 DUF3073 domain-containing protein [Streptomyces sp. WMMC500]